MEAGRRGAPRRRRDLVRRPGRPCRPPGPVHGVLGNNDHQLVGALPEHAGARPGRGEGGHGPRQRARPPAGRRRMPRRFPDAQLVVFGHSHAPVDARGPRRSAAVQPGLPHPAPGPACPHLRSAPPGLGGRIDGTTRSSSPGTRSSDASSGGRAAVQGAPDPGLVVDDLERRRQLLGVGRTWSGTPGRPPLRAGGSMAGPTTTWMRRGLGMRRIPWAWPGPSCRSRWARWVPRCGPTGRPPPQQVLGDRGPPGGCPRGRAPAPGPDAAPPRRGAGPRGRPTPGAPGRPPG